MKLSNRKIDLFIKLVFYLLPLIYCMFIALSTESPTMTSFLTPLVQWFDGIMNEGSLFQEFGLWFANNITSSNGVILVLYYTFYLVFVEFVVLFKNILTWIFKLANNLIERGIGND